MTYQPNQNPTWAERDNLDPNDSRRIIKGADFGAEFDNIKDAFDSLTPRSAVLASVKFNGTDFQYGYNVSSVEDVGSGAWRVNFENPINDDEGITLPDGGVANPGDFAAVVTPYTTNNRMVIATITDQREAYVDIVFRELSGSDWQAPSTQGFAFVLIDQVP